VCQAMLIGMRGQGLYIDKTDIIRIIEKFSRGSLLNKPVLSVKLKQLENVLEASPWIKDAELYFDSKDALHVFVEERQPVARIFTKGGRSFYIDSSGHSMPLLDKLSARVPVVTGFPGGVKWNAKDSMLMEDVKELVCFIYQDAFWNAQVGQIDITAERKFELIPVIGNHVIRLGAGKGAKEKLDRLFVFYKQVLSKVGFNSYAALDLQYKGQVVAVKKTAISPVDSIQLQKNIEDLITRAQEQMGDEGFAPVSPAIAPQKDSTVSSMTAQTNHVPVKTNSNPIQTKIQSPPVKTNPAKSIEDPKKPKAVMRRE
ncbi:MAG: cell division protein FtsQ/DivIB, partial [Flavisolibacter sp.]